MAKKKAKKAAKKAAKKIPGLTLKITGTLDDVLRATIPPAKKKG